MSAWSLDLGWRRDLDFMDHCRAGQATQPSLQGSARDFCPNSKQSSLHAVPTHFPAHLGSSSSHSVHWPFNYFPSNIRASLVEEKRLEDEHINVKANKNYNRKPGIFQVLGKSGPPNPIATHWSIKSIIFHYACKNPQINAQLNVAWQGRAFIILTNAVTKPEAPYPIFFLGNTLALAKTPKTQNAIGKSAPEAAPVTGGEQ